METLLVFTILCNSYATYNSKNAIISANNPVASEKANPRIAYENNCPLKEGFLDTLIIKPPITTPIPIPAPINPVVAKPVPIIFAACIILEKYHYCFGVLISFYLFYKNINLYY